VPPGYISELILILPLVLVIEFVEEEDENENDWSALTPGFTACIGAARHG
jgi:hypothetical protein